MLATRSQLSAEFIILFAGILLIFVFLFSTFFDKQQELTTQEIIAQSKDVVHEIAWSTNAVFVQGYGANISLRIPTTLQGTTDFELFAYNNSVWVFYDGGSYSYPLLTQNVSLIYTKKSSFTIYNTGSEVVIS